MKQNIEAIKDTIEGMFLAVGLYSCIAGILLFAEMSEKMERKRTN